MLNDIKRYDIKRNMKLGVWQTNILHRFIVKNFNTESYNCGFNGVMSYIKGVDINGYGYTVEIENRDWGTNKITITHKGSQKTINYDTVYDFKSAIGNIELK